MRLAALLVFAALSAGCAAPEGIAFGGSSRADAGAPYYKEWRSFVDGSHLKVYEVPIDLGASLVNVTLALEPRTNGVPVPDVALARLDVTLLDPEGVAVQAARVDVQKRAASFSVPDPAPGVYTVQVSGVGTSRELEGARYGDAYLLSVEVLYAG